MSIQPPLRESDLIFSSASSVLKDALGELKRGNLSIKNRLRSIKEDSEFVIKVADAYELPLIANERCGSWYIPPERKAGSAYFKSTDGHFHQWGFSLRRLNLQVFDVLEHHGGWDISKWYSKDSLLIDVSDASLSIPRGEARACQTLCPKLFRYGSRL